MMGVGETRGATYGIGVGNGVLTACGMGVGIVFVTITRSVRTDVFDCAKLETAVTTVMRRPNKTRFFIILSRRAADELFDFEATEG